MLPIQTILHPTDFSKPSDYALQVARALARDQVARLIILHVVSATLAVEKEGFGEQLDEELRRLPKPDAATGEEHRLVEGDPATEILRIAQDTNSDLIVMGTHGRSGLGRLLMGSVAEQVVRKASCPVLTVKAS